MIVLIAATITTALAYAALWAWRVAPVLAQAVIDGFMAGVLKGWKRR